MEYFKNITYALMILASISLLVANHQAVGGSSRITAGVLLFYLYMMVPFLIIWRIIFQLYISDASNASRISFFITSILIAAMAIAVSFESLFGNVSSTSATIFFFVPFYLLLMIAVIYPVLRLFINYVIRKGVREKEI